MTLQEVVNQAAAGPQSPGVPKQPGPPAASSDPNLLTNEEAAKHVCQLLIHVIYVTLGALFASVIGVH